MNEPPNEPLSGPPAKATVSLPVKPVATFPSASFAVTVNSNPAPAVTVKGGCEAIDSCVAAPGKTEIELLVADVSVPLVTASVYPLPVRFKFKPENVAMPLVALALNEPLSVPPGGPLAKESVSLPLKLVAIFPSASLAVTVSANALPAVTVEAGWDVMISCVATPGVTEIVLLVADVSVPLVTARV